MVIANPGYGRDGRFRIAEILAAQHGSDVRVIGNEWTRVWMCYAPTATRVQWSGSCDHLSGELHGATQVILDGEVANCPPSTLGASARELWTGKTKEGPIALYALEPSTPATIR